MLRRRTITIASVLSAALTIASVGMYRSHIEEQHAREEARLKSLDLGRFTLVLEPFDWDPESQRATPHAVTPDLGLSWTLHQQAAEDIHEPGAQFDMSWVVRGAPRVDNGALIEDVQAHGGPAFLVIARRNCAPSTIPLARLPGYALREAPSTLRLQVPTCEASLADTVEIPSGEFLFGGPGEPPSSAALKFPKENPEQRMTLPSFRIDRTEVTNAEFDLFVRMSIATKIERPKYPDTVELRDGGAPRKPVVAVNWIEARAYCRFLGKELPTSQQWTRALRGRIENNPHPRRNFPWGVASDGSLGKLKGTQPVGTAEVGSFPRDRTDEGVLDLAGNVTEWTSSTLEVEGVRVVRGSNWDDDLEYFTDFMAIQNPRAMEKRDYSTGLRCVSSP